MKYLRILKPRASEGHTVSDIRCDKIRSEVNSSSSTDRKSHVRKDNQQRKRFICGVSSPPICGKPKLPLRRQPRKPTRPKKRVPSLVPLFSVSLIRRPNSSALGKSQNVSGSPRNPLLWGPIKWFSPYGPKIIFRSRSHSWAKILLGYFYTRNAVQ